MDSRFPQRAQRPWLGQQEVLSGEKLPSHDPHCYLCPGNQRAAGVENPQYEDVFVFANDFPALLEEHWEQQQSLDAEEPLFVREFESGICKVICFSPRHDLTLAQMDVLAIRKVVDCWCDLFAELGQREDIQHVQIFENKGQAMGCSNPHPHGQVWAQAHVPELPAREQAQQQAHFTHNMDAPCWPITSLPNCVIRREWFWKTKLLRSWCRFGQHGPLRH
jgi:UDPglucose--hexose-1-phosphate uridylyltransferase